MTVRLGSCKLPQSDLTGQSPLPLTRRAVLLPRLRVVSIVVSIQTGFLPFSAPSPPDKSRELSRESAILPDLGPKR